jgi:hypothetical protein
MKYSHKFFLFLDLKNFYQIIITTEKIPKHEKSLEMKMFSKVLMETIYLRNTSKVVTYLSQVNKNK